MQDLLGPEIVFQRKQSLSRVIEETGYELVYTAQLQEHEEIEEDERWPDRQVNKHHAQTGCRNRGE